MTRQARCRPAAAAVRARLEREVCSLDRRLRCFLVSVRWRWRRFVVRRRRLLVCGLVVVGGLGVGVSDDLHRWFRGTVFSGKAPVWGQVVVRPPVAGGVVRDARVRLVPVGPHRAIFGLGCGGGWSRGRRRRGGSGSCRPVVRRPRCLARVALCGGGRGRRLSGPARGHRRRRVARCPARGSDDAFVPGPGSWGRLSVRGCSRVGVAGPAPPACHPIGGFGANLRCQHSDGIEGLTRSCSGTACRTKSLCSLGNLRFAGVFGWSGTDLHTGCHRFKSCTAHQLPGDARVTGRRHRVHHPCNSVDVGFSRPASPVPPRARRRSTPARFPRRCSRSRASIPPWEALGETLRQRYVGPRAADRRRGQQHAPARPLRLARRGRHRAARALDRGRRRRRGQPELVGRRELFRSGGPARHGRQRRLGI